MFEIDLENIDEGEWFPYQDSHFDQETGKWIFDDPISDAKVRVRPIQPLLKERFHNRKKVSEHVLNPTTRSMERLTYYKEHTPDELKKESDDTWDYAITGFEGFTNKRTGEVIECTRANKLKLMATSAFDRFVGNCLKILEGTEKRIQEEAEKNS